MVTSMKHSAHGVSGDVDTGYGKVADAFRDNFVSGREIGAAVTIYRDGAKVVDLWGGQRNGVAGTPWERDTLVNVFSTTKGVAALSIALAHSKGLLCYEARVADYWPEFAQNGKESITVRQLMSHQAGLSHVDPPLRFTDLANQSRMSAVLAAQTPAWTPGRRHGYHAVSLGWYAAQLIRHVDPFGRSLGRFFADEIARPLGLDLYIGLPKDVDRRRVALLKTWTRAEMLLHTKDMAPRFVLSMLNPRSLASRTFGALAERSTLGCYNTEEMRVVEIPAANGTATARSIARLYGSAAIGGTDVGLSAPTWNALSAPAIQPSGGSVDKVLRVETSYSLGFFKPFPGFTFGSSSKAFGTPGAGGSFGFCDPDTGIGFGYTPNKLGFHIWSDPRELSIRQALFHDILKVRPQT